MIDYDFLDIEYNGKLPMIIYTKTGWQIESDQYADELLNEWIWNGSNRGSKIQI
jgi:hypothetical protein